MVMVYIHYKQIIYIDTPYILFICDDEIVGWVLLSAMAARWL